MPNLSPALSDVVMTALAKSPGARYQTARDFRHAIEAAVGRPADVEEVGDYMTRLWPPGDEERTALSTLAAGTEERSGPALQSVSSGTWAGQNATPSRAVVVHETPPTAEELAHQLLAPSRPSGRLTRAPPEAPPPAPPPAPSPAPPSAPPQPAVALFDTPQFDSPRQGPSLLLALLAVLGVLAAGGLGFVVLQQREQLQKTPPAPQPVVPVTAVVPVAAVVPVDAVSADAGVVAPVAAAAATDGEIQVQPPVVVHVFDGKEDLGATPLTLKRPPGPVTLRLVNKAQNIDQAVKLTVEAGGTAKVDALARGALSIKVDPWAYVKVDGKSYGQTPVTVKALYEGSHLVELQNVGLNEKRRFEVKVKGGETKSVKVNLLENSADE